VLDGTYIVSYAPLDASQICHSDLDQPITLTTEEMYTRVYSLNDNFNIAI
jgi:hypothetical protein